MLILHLRDFRVSFGQIMIHHKRVVGVSGKMEKGIRYLEKFQTIRNITPNL